MSRTAKPLRAVALPRIETDEGSKDYKMKFKGRLVASLTDFSKAYEAEHGQSVDIETLVPYMLEAYMEADKNFASWRKGQMQEDKG